MKKIAYDKELENQIGYSDENVKVVQEIIKRLQDKLFIKV